MKTLRSNLMTLMLNIFMMLFSIWTIMGLSFLANSLSTGNYRTIKVSLFSTAILCLIIFIISVICTWIFFSPHISYDKKSLIIRNRFSKKTFLWDDIVYYENGYRGFIAEFIPNTKVQLIQFGYAKKEWNYFLGFLNSNFGAKRVHPYVYPGD